MIRVTAISQRIAGEGEPPAGDPPVNNPPTWVAQLPDDLKSNEAFSGFKTVGEFGQAYLDLNKSTEELKQGATELEGKIGNMIPKLGDNPTPEEMDAFRSAAEIPKTPEEYVVKRPDWPEKMGEYPEQMEKDFLKLAHGMNYTNAQVQMAYDYYLNNILQAGTNITELAEKRKEATAAELQKAWGNDYAANSEIATRAFWFLADQETVDLFDNSGFGDNPLVIKLLHKVGMQILGDKLLKSAVPPGGEPPARQSNFGIPVINYPSMEKKE